MTPTADLAAYQREISELLTVIAGKPGGDAFLDALAAYQAEKRTLANAGVELLNRAEAAEAKVAELKTALDTIEEIPEYNTTDYEKIRLILAAIKRTRAALGEG